MSYRHFVSGGFVSLVLLAGPGCQQKAVTEPTGEEARRHAKLPPPPPAVMAYVEIPVTDPKPGAFKDLAEAGEKE